MNKVLMWVCRQCKDKTKHQLRWLGGEKESYYLATCKVCGTGSHVPSYIVRDAEAKKVEDLTP